MFILPNPVSIVISPVKLYLDAPESGCHTLFWDQQPLKHSAIQIILDTMVLVFRQPCCYCSVAKLCLTLCDPTDSSMPGFPVSRSLPKPMSIESMMPSNHLILCRPLLLLSSVFPSIRAFSNELTLLIRWPKYWSSSFSINPSMNIQG